ncbi:MAG: hypothetical protein BJ554DRAFT_7455 [Olpidium bornovanus]|uniref:Uncharacterized protein n=1 Tax=Olpidium bornovanus TaxID=278681 RepID=A0A8H8DJ88_9FUNG|nr:MAG: hypothetical protein BJ554DRAFT_7455 [Olpidium bornovanus]
MTRNKNYLSGRIANTHTASCRIQVGAKPEWWARPELTTFAFVCHPSGPPSACCRARHPGAFPVVRIRFLHRICTCLPVYAYPC